LVRVLSLSVIRCPVMTSLVARHPL
jgi:hypothetical protein